MNEEENITASRALRLKQGQPRYLVDGHEFPNEASNLTIDGNYPPFYVFDVDRQEHAEFGWAHRTKAEAQAVASRLNAREKQKRIEELYAIATDEEADPNDRIHANNELFVLQQEQT